MENLEDIRKAIVASGSITASDVVALRDIVYTDGKVEQAEDEFLFKLRKEFNDFGNLKEWNSFFIQAICDFIWDGERSPEAIDELEATPDGREYCSMSYRFVRSIYGCPISINRHAGALD